MTAAALCDGAKDRLHVACTDSQSVGSLIQVLVGLLASDVDNPYETVVDCLNQLFGEDWPDGLRHAMRTAKMLSAIHGSAYLPVLSEMTDADFDRLYKKD